MGGVGAPPHDDGVVCDRYASYFLLFLKLFVDNYILAPAAKKATAGEKAAPPVVAREAAKKIA